MKGKSLRCKSLTHNQPLKALLRSLVLTVLFSVASLDVAAQSLSGSGTEATPYLIYNSTDFGVFVSMVNADAAGTGAAAAYYEIRGNINASGKDEITSAFKGHLTSAINTITHRPYTITGLRHRMFTTVTDAVISNIMLQDVEISQTGYVGAICGTANGATRIFNCGILPDNPPYADTSTVASSGSYCGSLVGFLDGSARVVNCFSYANITGGTVKAGIVGYNNYASTYETGNPAVSNIRTMVMNCMFYGNIDFANGQVYPIYGGQDISNENSSRLNNYNYFLYEAEFSEKRHITGFNHALAAEKRYLERWEFFRYLVNSTRELASWYVYGSVQSDAQTKMLKWVLDRSVAPYPILKQQDSYTPGEYSGTGLYPSVVNYDPEYTFNTTTGARVSRSNVTTRNQGGILDTMGTSGYLSVTISMPVAATGGKGKPDGAILKISSRSLPIIDKDTAMFNFNYGKVQLPYYNEVGTGNYTGNKVVTGWMITAITAVPGDPYTAANYTGDNYDPPYYNYADRQSSNKDKYSISGRVFSQGAYFDVPDGVTSITIEPYWGYAAYLSDEGYDAYYTNGGSGSGNNWRYNVNSTVSIFGRRYTGGTSSFNNDNNQKVYTSISNALSRLDNLGRSTTTSIYDYAVVLVGNYHQKGMPENTQKRFSVMSVDLNYDNEPDYSLIIHSGKQEKVSPIRFDFINVPNAAMAHKLTSYTYMGILGNIKPKGWFETTNTTIIRFSQYEYDSENKDLNEPLILMGGLIDMFTSTNGSAAATHTKYMIVGGNVWFKVFNIGCHMDKTYATPHRPISVCGGEYNKFYLSGYLQPDAKSYTTNDGGQNAECYVSGGRFGEVAGAGYEQISGNVTWQIYDADMESFYGGGINDGKPVTGNITTTIRGGRIGLFCGGPKFGNMSANKPVTTTANDCIFGTFFGAGYGGTALTRVNSYNKYSTLTYAWNGKSEGYYLVPTFTNIDGDGNAVNGEHHRGTFVSGQGVSVNYEYENFEGSSTNTVGYLFVNYASLSVARCNNVTSTLTNCTIERNFYGGGSLGSVVGDATSTLHNCTVKGNVFGAGFSAQIPTVNVFPDGSDGLFRTIPVYNSTTGMFEKGVFPDPVVYKWSDKGDDTNTLVDDTDGHWIHTGVDLNSLGSVTGNVSITLSGTTTVGIEGDSQTGNVFGGGDESAVLGTGNKGNTTVHLQDNVTVRGNVFGGGNEGIVSGNSEVRIQNQP